MSDKLALMLEAERRGILPPDKLALLTEARNRGLVPGGAPTAQPETPEQPERSVGDSLKRAAGLTARYGVEGLSNLAGIVANPMTQLAGRGNFTDAVSRLLTRAGLPEPEGAEKITGEMSKAVVGAGPLVKGAQVAAGAMQNAPALVRMMAAAPGAEAVTQAAGAGAAEGVRASGGPEWAALIAGVTAPMAAQGAMGVASTAGRAVNELRRPLTQGGRDQIAADTLGRIVHNKGLAQRNLDDYLTRVRKGEIVGVPDSKPTAGAVAADYGLVQGEQAIARGDASPMFNTRYAENNAARLADLAKINATDERVAQLVAQRDRLTAPMREKAFAGAQSPVNLDRVRDAINRIRKTSAGGKQETARALETLDGWVVARQAEGRVGAEDAYALHQDINDLIRGKVGDDQGAVRLASGMATAIKQTLADEIEKSAPGFRKYLNAYSKLSRPIETLEAVRDRLGGENLSRVTTSGIKLTDQGAQFTLSQDKMRKAVDDLKSNVNLAPHQSDILSRVVGDLNAESAAQRSGKLPGSDTYQNMASANFLNRVFGESVAESAPGLFARKALGLVNKPFESRINDTIVNAYLDPAEMERLLKLARSKRGNVSLSGLLAESGNTARAGGLGGLLSGM